MKKEPQDCRIQGKYSKFISRNKLQLRDHVIQYILVAYTFNVMLGRSDKNS